MIMQTGKRFKVLDSVLVLDGTGTNGWVTIPAGVIVEIVCGPYGHQDELVELRWNGRVVTMFTSELVRCAEIKHQTANA
jgi:hypothetical protein